MDRLTHDVAARRFEMALGDQIAFVAYVPRGEVLVLTHAEVPAALNGRGIGGRLVQATLDLLRAENRRVDPLCPFIAVWIKRHPQYADMVATVTPGG
jgi:predicted GNAT family acetyltransferase